MQHQTVPQKPTGDAIMSAAHAAAREVFPNAAPTASDHANQLANRLCELLAPPAGAKVDLTTDKVERPVGDLFTVSGEHGRVSYDQFANRIELHDAYGDIEAMGKRWADQVAEAADRDDDAVFALLAEHYRTELAGGAR